MSFMHSFQSLLDIRLTSNAKVLISNTSGVAGAAVISCMVEMSVAVFSREGLSSILRAQSSLIGMRSFV